MESDRSKPHPARATLALAGVFLVMVGAAWVIVRYYRTSAREGALVLQEMRSRTLESLWLRESRQAHYEVHDASGHLLKRLYVARQAVPGGFEGVMLHTPVTGPDRRGVVRETWTVSDDLSKGDYQADYLSLNVRVRIRLDGGQVRLRATGMEDEASMEAPANYIPEGLEWLAVRMVAQGGKKATFLLVSNEESHGARSIRVGRVTMAPLGGTSVRCVYEGGGGSYSQTFQLDEAGEVLRVETGDGAVLTPVGAGPEPEAPEGPQTDSREEPGVPVRAGR